MHLKSLELSGFKSFAKKTELEFQTPITAIVGPNGSGKSNVAEAFRFVLGEQSIKSLRGKRGEDLIWGGSPSLARANRAAVKIVLDNEKRTFPVDFDAVTVERVVHRDGVNEYSINGSRTRLKDVQELLSSANIGPTGHHIISQGEADRILSASPKERREMIEDALGLKVYQYKKNESEKKLKKAQENMTHVESLRKEVEPHLNFLKRQVKKVEKALQLRDELTAFAKEYLKREELYLTYTKDALEKERIEPERELAELEAELTKARETLKTADDDAKRTALVSLEEQISGLRTKRQEAMRESGRIEGQISVLERTIENLGTQDESAVSVPFADVRRAIERVEQVAHDADRSEDAGVLRGVVEQMVRTLRSFLNEANRSKTDTPEADRLTSECAALKKERTEIEATLADIAKQEAAAQAEYDVLKQEIESDASEGREAEREVFRIMSRQRELSEELARITREAETLARDREEFEREVREAIVLIGRVVAEYKTLSHAVDGTPLTEEAVCAEDRERQRQRRRELEKMKIRLEELGGSGSDEVMKEYKEVSERDAFLARELADIEQSIEKLQALIADLEAELNAQFNTGIEKIATEFNRFFVLMFGGGSASLTRVRPTVRTRKKDELSERIEEDAEAVEEEDADADVQEGIDIDVKLPNKRVRGLEMLSGGERALTSIALIFAMSQVNPPLFVILDETDAALDEANSRRYGDMIEALAKRSQLILITHNRETMSRAGVLYGVTMAGDGVSKLLSVKFEDAVATAK